MRGPKSTSSRTIARQFFDRVPGEFGNPDSAEPVELNFAQPLASGQLLKKAKVERISLHECRHTFASLLIAAGVNPKAIQTFMGHATIQTTFDQYGHLMPWSRDEARELVDAYLAASCAIDARVASVAERFAAEDTSDPRAANPHS